MILHTLLFAATVKSFVSSFKLESSARKKLIYKFTLMYILLGIYVLFQVYGVINENTLQIPYHIYTMLWYTPHIIILYRYSRKYLKPVNAMMDRIERLANEFSLTRRESEVVNLINAGLSNDRIAKNMKVSKKTADNHISNIYMKLGIKNRVELVNMLMYKTNES